MSYDPVMRDLDLYLDDLDAIDAENAAAEEKQREELQDELLAIVKRLPPVDAHNLKVRVWSAWDDLERLQALLERQVEAVA